MSGKFRKFVLAAVLLAVALATALPALYAVSTAQAGAPATLAMERDTTAS